MSESQTDRLDEQSIRQAMDPAARARLAQFTVTQETDSTNTFLQRLPGKERHAHAVLADRQTGGRGRRRKTWHSPPGGNIYLSLGWAFADCDWPISTLPLVAGIAVCKALSRARLREHGIKWPNDILVDGRKLAGILVEMQSASGGPASAVIGVGLNVRMPESRGEPLEKVIGRPWTDLETVLSGGQGGVSRNRLAAWLLEELLHALESFRQGGFPAFHTAWRDLDLLYGKTVRVEQDGSLVVGEARGVDADGALLLDTGATGLQVVHSGEASVRYGQ